MLDDELKTALIEQMNAEFESYYLYLAMQGYFEKDSWAGMANWMAHQAEEERMHAMKFYDHLLQRGKIPKLLAIKEPKEDWENPFDAFSDALEHEKEITNKINKLLEHASQKHDHPSQNLLRWFIDEQVEEEDTVGTIVDRLSRVKDDPQGLMLIDAELGERENIEL